MDLFLEKVNSRIELCTVNINDNDNDIKILIEENLIEIVKGKMLSERLMTESNETIHSEEYIDTIRDSAKFIYKKSSVNDRVGIMGELLFHAIMRTDRLKKFLSLQPTIGYSDCYQGFYKGFDGCYFFENNVWLAEVKSKVKSSAEKLDKDNETKLKVASKQLKKEANDNDINRWEKVKCYVGNQLSKLEINDTNIYSYLSKKQRTNYNQMLCSLIICESNKFNIEHIKSYIESLYHENIDNQKIFAMSICQKDYNNIIKYIKEICGEIIE